MSHQGAAAAATIAEALLRAVVQESLAADLLHRAVQARLAGLPVVHLRAVQVHPVQAAAAAEDANPPKLWNPETLEP